MGGKPDEKMLPLVYVLMQKRTYKAYSEVFDQLKRIAKDKYNSLLSPEIALTDFEKAARKALKYHFSNIKLKGCFFHFKQAVGRWIFKNGYKQTYNINTEFKQWFRKLTSLAIVPLDKILEAWDIVQLESLSMKVNVKPILKYFQNTWMINGHFPPEEWNQYGSMDDRTNNFVESYNSKINKKLKTKPNLLRFCDFIIDEENLTQISYLQSNQVAYYMKNQTKAVIWITFTLTFT